MTDRDGKIWVTVDPNRCVLIIDPITWEIERTIHLEVPGHLLAPSADGNTVYSTAKEYPVVVEVDVATKQITGRIPLPVGGQAIRVSSMGLRSMSAIATPCHRLRTPRTDQHCSANRRTRMAV